MFAEYSMSDKNFEKWEPHIEIKASCNYRSGLESLEEYFKTYFASTFLDSVIYDRSEELGDDMFKAVYVFSTENEPELVELCKSIEDIRIDSIKEKYQ